MEEQLVAILSNNTALPVLFIGSGITRRYLNLPNWEGLLREFCIEKPYEYYYDKATRDCRDEPEMVMPTTADYIEADFNEIWYTSAEYEDSRREHQEEMKRKISPFKILIAEYIKTNSTKIVDEYKDEVTLLGQIGNKHISCIITTNYDCFLENCFGEGQFHTYIGQDDLLFSTTYEIGELYKIHGCCSKPESIVVNADDYKKFEKKRAYLSSKILTMFLERPVIFLGYSINDPNIKGILDSIADCLEDDQLDRLSERLLFVERNHDEDKPDAISSRRITTKSGKTISMQSVSLRDYSPLYKALMKNQAKYDVKVLRRIKSQLYDLVEHNTPTERLYIATSLEGDDKEVDFVIGVGVYGQFGNVGYRAIKAEEIFLSMLGRSEIKYDDRMLLKEVLPSLFKGRNYLPVCYYIAQYADKNNLNPKLKSAVKGKITDFCSNTELSRIRRNGNQELGCSIQEYYSKNGIAGTLSKIPLLSEEKIDPNDLLGFINLALNDHPSLLAIDGNIHPSRSQFKKCICIWDWLMYGNEAKDKIASLLE